MVLNRRSTVKDTMNRHCERSEAIHVSRKERMDCFAALAMTMRKRPGSLPAFVCVPRMRRKHAASRPGHVVAYFASARFGGEAGHDLIRVS